MAINSLLVHWLSFLVVYYGKWTVLYCKTALLYCSAFTTLSPQSSSLPYTLCYINLDHRFYASPSSFESYSMLKLQSLWMALNMGDYLKGTMTWHRSRHLALDDVKKVLSSSTLTFMDANTSLSKCHQLYYKMCGPCWHGKHACWMLHVWCCIFALHSNHVTIPHQGVFPHNILHISFSFFSDLGCSSCLWLESIVIQYHV